VNRLLPEDQLAPPDLEGQQDLGHRLPPVVQQGLAGQEHQLHRQGRAAPFHPSHPVSLEGLKDLEHLEVLVGPLAPLGRSVVESTR
jgi:hypothetical protein